MIDRRTFVSGIAAASIARISAPAVAAGTESRRLAQVFDHYFASFVKARDFSGIIAVERGRGQLFRTFGRADFASGELHTPHTRYAAESISKMFTKAAVLALQASGKLSMDDHLSRFIPDFPRAGEITIRQLVDHQAGISRDLSFAGKDGARPHSMGEIVSMIAKTENGSPGKSAYSNNGYRILARVIELAGKGGFEALVNELVFQPRHMAETVFGGSNRSPMPRRATGYVPGIGWGTIRKADAWDFSNSRGAASFYTSPADLIRFLRTLPLEPVEVGPAKGAAAGARFSRTAGHDGFGSGFANLAFAYPDEDTRFILLGNIQSGLFMSLQKDIRAILAGDPVQALKVERSPELGPSQRWQDFIGQYELQPGAPLIIRRKGNRLEVSAGEEFHPLIATAPDRFFMRLRYATMSFPAAPAPVDAIRWEEGGSGFTLKKLN